MKNGTWWNDNNVVLVEVDGQTYGLYGWNGERYNQCFKVSKKGIASKESYTLTPVYGEYLEDEENGYTSDIIDYEVINN